MIDAGHLQRIIRTALEEDVNTGDITTASTVALGTQIKGRFIAKAPGLLCGTEVVAAVFAYVDDAIQLDFHFSDGQALNTGM